MQIINSDIISIYRSNHIRFIAIKLSVCVGEGGRKAKSLIMPWEDVRKREREREREKDKERERERERESVCVRERE